MEDLATGALLGDLVAGGVDTWHGPEALAPTYRSADGLVPERLLFREDGPRLAIVGAGSPWAFDRDDGGPGGEFGGSALPRRARARALPAVHRSALEP